MSDRRSEIVFVAHPSGGGLEVYFSYHRHPAAVAVVYVHGFGSTRLGEKSEAVEAACARRQWSFVSFDFRGHGKSTGTMLELRGTGLQEDLVALRDHLSARGVLRLCLVGSSMGGWASAWFALQNPGFVLACVLIAPALDFLRSRWTQLTEAQRTHWKSTGRLRFQSPWVQTEISYGLVEEMDLFPMDRLAAGLAVPLLIIHGVRDEIVPYSQSLRFVEMAAFPDIELLLHKNGDHRLLAYKVAMAEAACRFFEPYLPEQTQQDQPGRSAASR